MTNRYYDVYPTPQVERAGYGALEVMADARQRLAAQAAEAATASQTEITHTVSNVE